MNTPIALEEELIQEIVTNLEPFRSGPKKPETILRAEISKEVRDQVELLKRVVPDFFLSDVRSKVRREAARIIRMLDKQTRAIGDLDRQLKTAPPELKLRLEAYVLQLQHGLVWMRGECVSAVNATKVRGDPAAEQYARSAWYLIKRFSKNRPGSGSANSPFRRITSLLHQLVTGAAKERDFERACDAILKKDPWAQHRRALAAALANGGPAPAVAELQAVGPPLTSGQKRLAKLLKRQAELAADTSPKAEVEYKKVVKAIAKVASRLAAD